MYIRRKAEQIKQKGNHRRSTSIHKDGTGENYTGGMLENENPLYPL